MTVLIFLLIGIALICTAFFLARKFCRFLVRAGDYAEEQLQGWD